MEQRNDLACITTPSQGNRLPAGVPFVADNGCFGKGYPGDDEWIAWLGSLDRNACSFAVAPDVVGDARATLERSAPFLPRIREFGFRAALVAQNGLEDLDVPWDTFDVLFVGGDTAWKIGPAARSIVAEAKKRGKWVHMGRVNTLSRLRYAAEIGVDSADGTYLVFGPDQNLPRLLRWLTEVNQPRLGLPSGW
jgi:hypothetical protein